MPRAQVDAPDVVLFNPPYAQRLGGGVVPPMGLAYVAGALRRHGATVQIVDLVFEMQGHSVPDVLMVKERVSTFLNALPEPPKMIGVGPLVTANLKSAAAVVGACRDRGATIIAGGPLCAVPDFGEVALDRVGADAFVAGDGETPILAIWEAVLAGKSLASLPGVGVSNGSRPAPYREQDLDSLALPTRDLLANSYHASVRRKVSNARTTSAFLSRGCPYSCSFCAAPLSSGRKIRRFSPARVTLELDGCGSLGYGSIVFYDDCLFVASADLDERIDTFVSSIESSTWTGEYQLELRCDAVVRLAERSMERLRASGCRQINMGIEKATSSQMALLRKRLTPDVAEAACTKVVASGMRAAGTFIVGGPGETLESLGETALFAGSLDLDFAHFNPMAIYPGTALFNEVFTHGENWYDLCMNETWAPLGDILWRSLEVSLPDVLEAVSDGYATFYSDERLRRVLSRQPANEATDLAEAYAFLRDARKLSWDFNSADVGAMQC